MAAALAPGSYGLHSNVYVRNISPHVDEPSLRTLFEHYGPVDSVKLVPGKVAGGNSYAFVNYSTVDAAQNAIAYLNNYAVHGVALEVKLANAPVAAYSKPVAAQAVPNDNLYVAHVPVTYTEDRVVAIFQQHGLVLSCKVLTASHKAHEQNPGHTAMVRMGSLDEAARAIQALNGSLLPDATSPLVVKYADTPEQKALRKSRSVARPPPARYHPYSGGAAPHPAGPPAAYAPPVVQELHFAPQAAPPVHMPPGQPQPYAPVPATPHMAPGQPQPYALVQAAPHMAPAQPQPYTPVQAAPHMAPAQPQYTPPASHHHIPPPDPYQHMQPPGMAPSAAYPPPHAGVPNGHSVPPSEPTSASVYIKNLPAEANKLYLYETFAPLGAVKSVKAMANDESGLCTGVGFVNFAHPEAAQQAVVQFNGAQVGDKFLYVALQPAKVQRAAHHA